MRKMADFLMDKDTHEGMLNELLDKDLDHSRKAEILQELRTHHTAVSEGVTQLEESNSKYQKDNDDLTVSNSKLFRELGVVGNGGEETKVDEKEFSEEVTIDDIV